MASLDVSGYLDDGALDLTGVASKRYPDGHTYHVESPSWPDALRLRRLISRFGGSIPDRDSLAGDALADLTGFVTAEDGAEVDFHEKLLGPAYGQMIDDGVPPVSVDRLVSIVAIHFGMNEQSAQILVAAATGEALARENRASRRTAAKKPASSPRKAGSNSSPASGARNTPAKKAAASTRGRGTSAASKGSQAKTA